MPSKEIIQSVKFDRYLFEKTEIEGVPIFWKNLPWAETIELRIGIRAGGYDDPEGKEGLAHFLEHVALNGSPLLPTSEAVNDFSRAKMLGTKNASTGMMSTTYEGACLSADFADVAEKMFDLVYNPLFNEVENDREIITQEMRAHGFNNPKKVAEMQESLKEIYGAHPLSRTLSPIGWPETLVKITEKDLRAWHAEKYCKENSVIVIVGDVSKDSLEILRPLLTKIPSGKKKPVFTPLPREAKVASNRKEISASDIGVTSNQTEMEFVGIIPKDIPKAQARVLEGILGELGYRILRQQLGACYSTGVSCQKSYYCRHFNFRMKIEPSKQKLVEEAAWKLINDTGAGKYDQLIEEEILLYAQHLRINEDASGSIADSAISEALREGEVSSVANNLAGFAKVTPAAIKELIKTYITPDKIYTHITHPSKE